MTDEASLASTMYRFSSLALSADDIIVVVGLAQRSEFNFRAGRIVELLNSNGRIGVKLLHGNQEALLLKRSNLLRAEHPDDRDVLLTRIVWECQQELRVVRNFLLDMVRLACG